MDASRAPSAPDVTVKIPRPETISGEPIPRVIAGVLGLCGFSTALFVGMVAGNPPVTALGRALLCMAACYAVGRVLGFAGSVAVGEAIEKYKADRPAPEPPAQLVELQDRHDRHNRIVEEMQRAA